MDECIGTALGAMGTETFSSVLPLNLEVREVPIKEVEKYNENIKGKHNINFALSFSLLCFFSCFTTNVI